MMDRRGFLRGILLAGMAPAIVKAANLMKIPPGARLAVPVQEQGRFVQYEFGENGEFDARTYCGSGFDQNITLGWKPQFIMVKRMDAPGDWQVHEWGKPTTLEDATPKVIQLNQLNPGRNRMTMSADGFGQYTFHRNRT